MGTATAPKPTPVSLEDKYAASAGTALMSGVQALVRLVLEQRRLDTARGLDTAAFVSGYQGSPLGGLDFELGRAKKHLGELGVVFQPGLNEELAATAVAGTQLLGELERRTVEGVVGFWYGKNPGLDRAADALRHGNVSGTAPLGGAVALVGDDPGCKSSTIPSSCEPMCRSLVMPVLAPGTVQELLELGLHAVAMSRASGLWSAIKVVADVADASATVQLEGLGESIPLPEPRLYEAPVLLPPTSLEAELDQLGARLQRAIAYSRQAGFNRIVFEPSCPRRAVVAAGLAHEAVVRALADLGVGEAELDALGLRLAKVSMPWPLDPAFVTELAAGVEEVLVVEEKLPFLESQLKEELYGGPSSPRIVGKRDAGDRELVPLGGTVGAEEVVRLLARWLPEGSLPEAPLAASAQGGSLELPTLPARTPYFCSGCPHNRSTKASPDSLVGAGIGCHAMVALDDADRGRLVGLTQMGGEGAQWLGLAPFTEDRHFTQNVGDGTFHHSASLALRAAVAAEANLTFKLLYNDAVAMTGGQHPEGQVPIPALTRLLAAEGVRATIVVTPEPKDYRRVKLDPIATVRHRDELEAVEAELRELGGVTVLIYDDRCATEERRLQKRKLLPTPTTRVWINERVCEGCGDCGEQSTCLSVQPIDTELGRKTRIHQASCNQDYSCLKGDCPSFVVVEPGKRVAHERVAAPTDLPQPPPRFGGEDVLLRMPGIGGTGVVTVSQVLQMAAHLDGLEAAGLEQIGLAQKGGPVISDVRIGPAAASGSLRANRATADVLIGFDLLGASSPQNLETADPKRTIAIVSTTAVPTAAMVTDTSVRFPREPALRGRIDAVTRRAENVYLDAQGLAVQLFGDHLPANLLLIGAAYQAGCLPISAAAIETAIELNGAAVDVNIEAFRWGRTAVARPELIEQRRPPAEARRTDPRAERLAAESGAEEPLRELLEARAADLIGYQSVRYAREYVEDATATAVAIDGALGEEGAEAALAYARGLHKLMAYKDEYEVARLHLDPVERARLEAEFGAGARAKIMLHPPLLRAMGLKRKLGFGRWADPGLRLLRGARLLRGRVWDPFGHAEVRRVERQLIGEYRQLIAAAIPRLRSGDAALFTELVELPDLIRGYEEIKLANVERFRARATEIVDRIGR